MLAANIFSGGVVAAVHYQSGENRKLEEEKEVYTNAIKRLSEAFENATLTIEGELLPVPSVEAIKEVSATLPLLRFKPSFLFCGCEDRLVNCFIVASTSRASLLLSVRSLG